MAAGDGAQDGDETQDQQDPMGAGEEGQRLFRRHARPAAEGAVEIKRLGQEDHRGEDQPDQDHGVHPPVPRREETVPEVEGEDQMKARQSDQQDRETGNPGEALFDGLELGHPIAPRLARPQPGQDHRRHHRHAADPENDAQDMQGAGDGFIHGTPRIAGAFILAGPAGSRLDLAQVPPFKRVLAILENAGK